MDSQNSQSVQADESNREKMSVRFYENENGVLKTGEELHAEHNSNGYDCECEVCVAYSTIMHIPCLLTIFEVVKA